MYPQYQFFFWLRSVFIPSEDFDYEYRDGKVLRKKQIVVGGWKALRRTVSTVALAVLITGGFVGVRRAGGITQAREVLGKALRQVLETGRKMIKG